MILGASDSFAPTAQGGWRLSPGVRLQLAPNPNSSRFPLITSSVREACSADDIPRFYENRIGTAVCLQGAREALSRGWLKPCDIENADPAVLLRVGEITLFVELRFLWLHKPFLGPLSVTTEIFSKCEPALWQQLQVAHHQAVSETTRLPNRRGRLIAHVELLLTGADNCKLAEEIQTKDPLAHKLASHIQAIVVASRQPLADLLNCMWPELTAYCHATLLATQTPDVPPPPRAPEPHTMCLPSTAAPRAPFDLRQAARRALDCWRSRTSTSSP